MNISTVIHQGKLLKELVVWAEKTQKEVYDLTGVTPQWQRTLYRKKDIGDKNVILFSQRLGVDQKYFEGKIKLPEKPPSTVSEQGIQYSGRERKLEVENIELRKNLTDCQAKVIKLQEEVITLYKEKKTVVR